MSINKNLLSTITDKLNQTTAYAFQQKKRQKQYALSEAFEVQRALAHKKKQQYELIQKSKDYLQKVSTLSQETIRNFNIKSNKQRELLSTLRDQIETEIENKEKDHEKNLTDIIERLNEQMDSWMNENNHRLKENNQKCDIVTNNITKNILKIHREFKQQCQTRQQNSERIVENIESEIHLFKCEIQKQKQKCTTSQGKINLMISDIEQKLEKQIEKQTNKRKKNNEALLKLIQLACEKLQQHGQQ